MMNKVLVTGGTGFVGYWMRQTQPDNLEVTYLNRRGMAFNPDFILDKYIVHLAPVSPSKMIKLAKKNKARLLYCSSGIVYYPDITSEYRRNKLRWEKDCQVSGVDCVVARLFAFTGLGIQADKAVSEFHKRALNDEPIHIWGDGNTVRTYLHGKDLGKWMWAILLKGKSGECYDVGGDEEITMLELAQEIVKDLQSNSEIIIDGGVDPMPHYAPMDTAKTKQLLE